MKEQITRLGPLKPWYNENLLFEMPPLGPCSSYPLIVICLWLSEFERTHHLWARLGWCIFVRMRFGGQHRFPLQPPNKHVVELERILFTVVNATVTCVSSEASVDSDEIRRCSIFHSADSIVICLQHRFNQYFIYLFNRQLDDVHHQTVSQKGSTPRYRT